MLDFHSNYSGILFARKVVSQMITVVWVTKDIKELQINMPLPLGHSAIGLTVSSLSDNTNTILTKCRCVLYIVILSNLPDIDVLVGLVLQGDGNAFHRGPTHSLLFALFAGYIASKGHRAWSRIPSLEFTKCFLLVFSHTIADMLLTRSPVSIFWPFEINWSTAGCSGWFDVVSSVIFDSFRDVGIIFLCLLIIFIRYAGVSILKYRYQRIRN
jgi:membrane-bound metal-dependent hydrolase YbcI (DUF457 family)